VNLVETFSSQEFILLTWDRGKGQALCGESILVWIPQQRERKQALVASWTTRYILLSFVLLPHIYLSLIYLSI
jgi:hypothetical protein